ncbi:hypothetical protein HJFPF1_02555 [Paramyrothecium foliicola]|nr:hypothetical protein HJFPF1_02555 [Paramyrothecium foliicola]
MPGDQASPHSHPVSIASEVVESLQLPQISEEAYTDMFSSALLLADSYQFDDINAVMEPANLAPGFPRYIAKESMTTFHNNMSNCEHPSENFLRIMQPSLGAIPPWRQSLLQHYGPHNGWRHLVLPIARRNTLVMDAVLTVSAFHRTRGIDVSQTKQGIKPNSLYAQTILELQNSSRIVDCDRDSQHAIILTIMLLLTTIMVSGYSDFPILFGILNSALEAIGGDAKLCSGDVADFITRQVHKLRVYAAPLLSEEYGTVMLSSKTNTERMFDCLNYCLEQQPEHPDYDSRPSPPGM